VTQGIPSSESPGGATWERCSPDPFFDVGAPGCFDQAAVYGPALLADGDTLKMWYEGFEGVIEGPIRIGFAYSLDQGMSWVRHCQPALAEGGTGDFDELGVRAPHELRDGAGQLVLYCGGSAPSGAAARG